MQGPEPEIPVTPTKSSRNDGACHDDSDAEDPDNPSGQLRNRGTILAYEIVKRWVTGDRAEEDDVEIQVELENEMRNLMELSRQKTFPRQTSNRFRILESWELAYR